MADVFSDADSIKRRQMLLAAINQRSLAAPIEGNKYGIGQLLAKLGTSAVEAYGQEKLGQEASANRGQYSQELARELEKFNTTREGAPGGTLDDAGARSLMEGNVNPQLADPIKADPRRAVYDALASRFPEMQGIGKAGVQEMLVKKARDPNNIKVVNGKIVDTTDHNAPKVIGDYDDKFGEPYERLVDGKMMLLRKNLTTGKVEAVGSGPVVSIHNSGETEGQKALGKALPELFKETRDTYMKGIEARQSAERISELLKNPAVITGFAATPLAGLAAIGAQLGFTGPDAAAQTQALISELASQTLSQVKRLPGAITEKERPFLADAAAGRLEFTPQALAHIAGIAKAVAHNATLNAKTQFESAMTTPGGADVAKAYPLPDLDTYSMDPKSYQETTADRWKYVGGLPGTATATQPPAKPISLSEWMKQQRKGGR